MTDFTTNEWAILFLTLVAGWLLGLLSAPKGDRWKREYETERDAHAAYRRGIETPAQAPRTDTTVRHEHVETRPVETRPVRDDTVEVIRTDRTTRDGSVRVVNVDDPTTTRR